MKVEVLNPHGMCGGVKAAVAAAKGSGGAYCLGAVVHNEMVVSDLRTAGCRFVDDIEEVPDGAAVVFSAHGVPPAVRRRAEEKRLAAIDATCPFVARAHRVAREFAKSGLPVVVVGDPEHSEVKGIAGEAEDAPRPVTGCKIGVVVQTSMDVEAARRRVDALRREYDVVGVSPPCDASSARQDAVRRFDGDALLVLGSRTSANSRRLCECARCPSFFASDMDEVRGLSAELAKFGRVGVTSGASTPEQFFEDAVRLLSRR